ncbi:hypothetical protein QUF90_21385 [Desulfococcaceae bacterium HSG9]|nr:hypothetical protein [Desulfococcaceae bacterium HSG9]
MLPLKIEKIVTRQWLSGGWPALPVGIGDFSHNIQSGTDVFATSERIGPVSRHSYRILSFFSRTSV